MINGFNKYPKSSGDNQYIGKRFHTAEYLDVYKSMKFVHPLLYDLDLKTKLIFRNLKVVKLKQTSMWKNDFTGSRDDSQILEMASHIFINQSLDFDAEFDIFEHSGKLLHS